MRYRITFLRLLAAAVLLLVAPQALAAPLRVFVSVVPLRCFVERVGGDRVDVRVLVQPGQSPATYEPTPRQMAALGGADLFFRVGVPFERSWMGRIQSLYPRLPVVDLSAGMTLRPLGEAPAGSDQAQGHQHGAGEGVADPHVWTSPPRVMAMTRRIADTLARLDPAHEAAYRRRAEQFVTDLRALDAAIRRTLAGRAGQAFLVYHPAWGYFADTYGLRQVAIEVGGHEPGPRTLARVIERARAEDVRVIFVQPQYSRTNAEAVARATGATVVTADPLAEDYLANMRAVARAFAEALR